MKKWILHLVMTTLIFASWIQARNFQDIPSVAQQIADTIQRAVQNYKEGNVREGAVRLCDVVLIVNPSSAWPEGFAGAVQSARDSFQESDVSTGIGHVKKAIKILKPDYTAAAGERTGEVAGIARLIMIKIESAVENFKGGDADRAVLQILESLALLGPSQ